MEPEKVRNAKRPIKKPNQSSRTNYRALQNKIRQQEVVAELGFQALAEKDLKKLMDIAVKDLKDVLDTEFTKLLQLLPGEDCMVLRAGVGWDEDIVIDVTTVDVGPNSQAGYTLMNEKPVIVKDLRKETRFNGPNLLQRHNVISGMSVIIHGKEHPWGVLGVHTTKNRIFSKDEVLFLQAVANIIAQFIQQKQVTDERRQLMIQLDLERTRFESVLQQMPVGVLVADAESGRIVYYNQETVKLLRHPLAKQLGSSVDYGALHEDDTLYKKKEYPIFRALCKGEIITQETIRYKRGDGTVTYLSINAVPIKDQEGNITAAISTCQDIHERIIAEQHKDEFLGIVSHELKTPVTSVKAYAQVLQKVFASKEDIDAVIQMEKIDNQITRLTKLITDLLDASKIQSGRIIFSEESFDFDALVNEIVNEMQFTTYQHEICVEGSSNCIVHGDRERIGQVITNLLANAIKYSPNANKIILSIECNDEEVLVAVKDFGIGIDKAQQKRIFDRFYRVSEDNYNVYPGMGIGLYITSQILNRQGGRIWVDSSKGNGSTFYFTLPINQVVSTRSLT